MGQAIVSDALEIVNRREETERNKKKEQEQEEWKKNISEQITKLMEFVC